MGKYAVSACWILVLWLGHIASAPAATVQRIYLDHGGTTCRGARAADNNSLQYSPKGVRNIGTKPVFVTCDFDVGPNIPNFNPAVGIDIVTIAFLNLAGKNENVSCTLVSGILHATTSSSKTAFVEWLGGAGMATWMSDTDFGGEHIPA